MIVLGEEGILYRFRLILQSFTIVVYGESSGNGTIIPCRQVPSLLQLNKVGISGRHKMWVENEQ